MNFSRTLLLGVILLCASGLTIAQTFERNVRVNPDAAGARQAAPQMKVDRSGTIYVAWTDFRSNQGGDLYLSRSTDRGMTFSTPVPIRTGHSVPSGMQRGVQMAIGPDGTVHLLWEESGSGSRIHATYCRSTDGGLTFTTPRSIAADSALHNQDFPSIAVDSTGGVHVAWVDDREKANGMSENTQIYYTRSTDGGTTFSAPKRANQMPSGAGGSCECCNTSIAAGGDGSILISFRSNVANMRDIFIARSRDGGTTFDTAIQIASENWEIDACPMTGSSVAIDRNGDAYVAWRDSRRSAGSRQYIYFNVLRKGASAAEIDRRVSTSVQRANYPSVILDSAGLVSIVYQDVRNDNTDIYVVTTADSGTSFSPEMKPTDETGASAQELPIAAIGPRGERYLVWQDSRRDVGDIVFARDLGATVSSVFDAPTSEKGFQIIPSVIGGDDRATAIVPSSGVTRIVLSDVLGRQLGVLYDGASIRGQAIPLELGGVAHGLYYVTMINGLHQTVAPIIVR